MLAFMWYNQIMNPTCILPLYACSTLPLLNQYSLLLTATAVKKKKRKSENLQHHSHSKLGFSWVFKIPIHSFSGTQKCYDVKCHNV